jgi:hypothetical protein
MGKFTTIKELKSLDLLDWYNTDGQSISHNKSEVFKYECAIHRSSLVQNYEGTNALKIEVRQFIEQNISDTVIMDYQSLSYYYDPSQSSSSYGYQVTHGYYRFFFESEASQVMFTLKFAEYIVTKYRWQSDKLPHEYTENVVWTAEHEGRWR